MEEGMERGEGNGVSEGGDGVMGELKSLDFE